MTDAMRDAVRAICAPDCRFPKCACTTGPPSGPRIAVGASVERIIEALRPHTAAAQAAAVAEAVRVEREAIIEAVGAHDKTGREWVPGSFWDTLTNETIARIRSRTQEST